MSDSTTATPPPDEPLADIIAEGLALVRAAEERGLTLRLFGGVAIRVRSSRQYAPLTRTYNDIDLFAPRRSSTQVAKLFEARGYDQDRQFNAMHGHFRLIYNDTTHNRQVDVFVGRFEMCHTLPLGDRLHLHPLTLSPADLMLTKLQIVELNDKDQRDLLALVLDHEIGDSDTDKLSGSCVAAECAADWGLWRTVTGNLDRLAGAAGSYGLAAEEQALIIRRLQTLQDLISAQRKSRRWKTRALVGERAQWYELPEEVGGA
jgi:hypothetical protein